VSSNLIPRGVPLLPPDASLFKARFNLQFRPFERIQTWYICFDKQRGKRVSWQFFTNKKFSHIFMLQQAGTGCLKVEPLAWGCAIEYCETPIEDFLMQLVQSDVTALVGVVIDYRKFDYSIMRGLYNCVTIVKSVLGLSGMREMLVLSPKSLYKYLVRRSANVIKPYVPYAPTRGVSTVGESNGFK